VPIVLKWKLKALERRQIIEQRVHISSEVRL